MIPETIHFVWSGPKFPLPFSLAVLSARKVHPRWRLVIHTSREPESPWWDKAIQVAEVIRRPEREILEDVPGIGTRLVDLAARVPDSYPAGRSNLVRLAILLREGGWYLDCDTLCRRPLDQVARSGAVVGEELVWVHDQERVNSGLRPAMIPSILAFSASWLGARGGLRDRGLVERGLRRIWGRRELNNAVIGCEPGHGWIRRLLELSLDQDPAVRFALGPGLVNLGWNSPGTSELPHRMPPEVFYQFPPSQTSRYFQGALDAIPPEAAVLHWCSSNHRKLVAAMTPQAVRANAARGPWFREAAGLL